MLVQAYSFTSAPIAKALMEAHKRGVKVQVILDKSQRTEKYSSATFFQNVGIPTFIDDKHASTHNKVMVIDGRSALLLTAVFSLVLVLLAIERNTRNPESAGMQGTPSNAVSIIAQDKGNVRTG